MSSPTQRSLKKLRSEGWFVAIVEHWNSFTHRRVDLFNFGDLLAIRENETLLIQTTSGGNVAHRLEKIRQIPAAKLWLQSPNRKIQIHGWAKRGPRGKRKLWTCRELEVTQETFGKEPASV